MGGVALQPFAELVQYICSKRGRSTENVQFLNMQSGICLFVCLVMLLIPGTSLQAH